MAADVLDRVLDAVAQLHVRLDWLESRHDAEFNEADHPRSADGRFGSGGGFGYSGGSVFEFLASAEDEKGASGVRQAAQALYAERPEMAHIINSQMRDLGYTSSFEELPEDSAVLPEDAAPSVAEDKGYIPEVRSGLFHRRTSGGVDNGAGYMMYASNPEGLHVYGKQQYTADLKDIPKDEIVGADSALFQRKLKSVLTKAKKDGRLSSFGADVSVAALVQESNPSSIVDTAGIWDDQNLVSLIYEEVLEPNGWTVVETEDGIISFDAQHAKERGVAYHDAANLDKMLDALAQIHARLDCLRICKDL